MDILLQPRIQGRPANPEIATILAALGEIAIAISAVGSRVTCDPAPVGTDEDWLLLVDSIPNRALKDLGFRQDGSPQFYTGNDAGGFRSWRRGDLNIVTTQDREFYDRFLTATHLAKRFNLLDKGDRIALFQAMLYGVDVDKLEMNDEQIKAERRAFTEVLPFDALPDLRQS